MAMPKPSMAASMAATPTPLSASSSAARWYGAIMRLPTKPWQLPTMTGTLRIFWPKAIAVASVRAELRAPRTFSSSGITLAGEKKCTPQTASGREVAPAMSSMFSADVLEHSSAPGLHARSSSAKILRLRPIDSKTASMAMSTSARSA